MNSQELSNPKPIATHAAENGKITKSAIVTIQKLLPLLEKIESDEFTPKERLQFRNKIWSTGLPLLHRMADLLKGLINEFDRPTLRKQNPKLAKQMKEREFERY